MSKFRLSESLRQFSLEAGPQMLSFISMLLLQEAECLLCRKLGDSCEIPDSEAIQHFRSLEASFSKAKRTLDSFSQLSHVGSRSSFERGRIWGRRWGEILLELLLAFDEQAGIGDIDAD